MVLIIDLMELYHNWVSRRMRKTIYLFRWTSSVLIKKEVARIDKKEKEIIKTISYRLQIFDSTKLMASSLSNDVDNLAEWVLKIKCRYEHGEKNVKLEEFNTKTVTAFSNTQTLKMI